MPAVIPPVVTVAEEGTAIASRPTLNFVGASVTAADNSAQNRTDVTITGTGGGTTVTFAAGSGLPVFNVKSSPYSATGDGSTDDRAAIQAAIDAAQAVGGIVFFPIGYYRITSALTITASCTLQGEGVWQRARSSNRNWDCGGAVIWNASTTGNAITYAPTDGQAQTAGVVSGITIRDLGISTKPSGSGYTTTQSGGWGPLSTGTGIQLGGYRSLIENCWVTRHSVGINCNYGYFNEVRNTTVVVCKTTGIDFRGIENHVINCRVMNNDPEWTSSDANPARGTYGIRASGETNWVRGCQIINWQYGVDIADSGSFGCSILDCFVDAGAYCYVVGGERHTISACGGTACYFDPSGVWTDAVCGLQVSGNIQRVSNCHFYRGTTGISVITSNSVITGCVMRGDGTPTYSLSMDTDTGFNVIANNILTSLRLTDQSGYPSTFTGNTVFAVTGSGAPGNVKRGNLGWSDS